MSMEGRSTDLSEARGHGLCAIESVLLVLHLVHGVLALALHQVVADHCRTALTPARRPHCAGVGAEMGVQEEGLMDGFD